MNAASGFVQLLIVGFSAAVTENILLTRFLGMCPFLSVSRRVETARGLGYAVVFVLTGTSALNWALYRYVLVPLELEYLRFILFIVLIAASVQLVEMVLERYSPVLYQSLGIFLPLITVNCAILGGSLFVIIRDYTLPETLAFGFGSGVGWLLAIMAMAGIQEKLKPERLPRGLRGPGIALIIVGHMALAFLGFTGVLSGG